MAVVTERLVRWRPSRGGPVYQVLMRTDDADFDLGPIDPATGQPEHYNRILQVVVTSPRGATLAFAGTLSPPVGPKERQLKTPLVLAGPQTNQVIALGARVTTEGFSWDFTPDYVPVVPGSVSNPSLLTSGGDSDGGTANTTATFNATANGLIVIAWGNRVASPGQPTYTFTTDLTGQGAFNETEINFSNTSRHEQVYSQTGTSPGTGKTITNTYGDPNPNRTAWIVAEVTGHNAASPNSESTTGTGTTSTTPSLALVSIASGNLAIGTITSVDPGGGGIAPGANETEVAEADSAGATSISVQMQYGTDTTVNWSNLGSSNSAIAIEYQAAQVRRQALVIG